MEEESGLETPGWVVTFGDMMSLLLTFFIMLVSLSEVKDEKRYQAMVESFRRQFGHDHAATSLAPGNHKPRNARFPSIAVAGRARREDTTVGGANVQAPTGDRRRVTTVRPADESSLAGVVHFEPESAELTDQERDRLRELAVVLKGKPQRVEIRGHAARRPDPSRNRDDWGLAYDRALNTMRFLVREANVHPDRIRLSVAGPNEPFHIGVEPELMKMNSRVEVLQLRETWLDGWGSADERSKRLRRDESPTARPER